MVTESKHKVKVTICIRYKAGVYRCERHMHAVLASAAEMSSNTKFQERLLICIEKCGSANALAKRAGLSKAAIHRYQNGSEPARDKLVALAVAAGVSPFWLGFGYDPQGFVANAPESAHTGEPVSEAASGKWVSINGLEAVPDDDPSQAGFRRGVPMMMIRADIAPVAFLGADASQLAAFRMPDPVMSRTIEKNVWGIVALSKMPGSGIYCVLRAGQLTARYVYNDGKGNYRVSCDDDSIEPPTVYTQAEIGHALVIVGEVIVAGIWPKNSR